MAVIGAAGLASIKSHEGLRLRSYLDPAGIPTICYGHTGPEVRLGMILTLDQCETVLRMDIERTAAGIAPCIHAPLNQNQHDAIISFAYNVGVSRYCTSTLARKVNAQDFQGAAQEFPRWRYAHVRGRNTVLPGLLRRRQAEAALFITPPVGTPQRGALGFLTTNYKEAL